MKKILFILCFFVIGIANAQMIQNVSGTMRVRISGSSGLVESIDVWGTGDATTITSDKSTLQMLKKTLPADAADTSATWSETEGTGHAIVTSTGLMIGVSNGTATAKALANDGSGIYGTKQITMSNQVGINLISVAMSEFTTNSTASWGSSNATREWDASGFMKITYTGAYGNCYAGGIATINHKYRIRIYIKSTSYTGNIWLVAGSTNYTAVGPISSSWTAYESDTLTQLDDNNIYITMPATGTIDVDNIIIQEIP